MTTPQLLLLGLAAFALALLAAALWSIWEWSRSRRYGRLLAVDPGSGRGVTLRSSRWRLSGTPDELRQRSDGRVVPVEWKRRVSPERGPFPSHVAQVWAYCLLVEENYGSPPPYGVLRYGDGVEFEVPWDSGTRRELLQLRRAMTLRYRGEATPSPGRCRGCRFRLGCDARAL